MTNSKFWLCAGALFVPVLAGCGGSSSSRNTSVPIVPQPRSVTAALANGLTGTLAEDRSAVAVGGTVTYTMTLTNPTSQPVTYLSSFGPGMNTPVGASLTVFGPSGQVVYPLGAVSLAVGIGPPVTLAPGQSVTATETVSTTRMAGLAVTQGYSAAGIYNASAAFGVTPGTTSSDAHAPAVTATAGPLPVTAQ